MICSGMLALPISFGLGALGAWLVSRFAGAWGLIDYPDERKSHCQPTPRGGGLGICLAVMFSALLCHIPAAVWGTAVIMALAGLADDLWRISVRTRFLIQLGCAVSVVALAPHNAYTAGVLIPLGLFWVLYITGTANFFNFMDGIDGNAAIGGGIAFGALGIHALITGLPTGEYWFNLSVAVACLGFLPFNIHRAKVFMGDTGSVLLGFLFAVQVYRYAGSFILTLVLSGFLFLFYLDTLTTLFIRWREGGKLTEPHRRHIYQLAANQMGYPHWMVALSYGITQTVISCTLFLSIRMSPVVVIGVILAWTAAFVSFGHAIRRGCETFIPGEYRGKAVGIQWLSQGTRTRKY